MKDQEDGKTSARKIIENPRYLKTVKERLADGKLAPALKTMLLAYVDDPPPDVSPALKEVLALVKQRSQAS